MKSTQLSTMIHFREIYLNGKSVFAKSKNLQIENGGRYLGLGDPDRDVQTCPMSVGLKPIIITCVRTCVRQFPRKPI